MRRAASGAQCRSWPGRSPERDTRIRGGGRVHRQISPVRTGNGSPPALPRPAQLAPGTGNSSRSRGQRRGRTRCWPGPPRARHRFQASCPGLGSATSLRGPFSQLPHPLGVDGSRTGSAGDQAPCEMYSGRKPRSASSRDRPRAVWVRSLVPKLKNSACSGDRAGDQAGSGEARSSSQARDLDAALPVLEGPLNRSEINQLAQCNELAVGLRSAAA